MKGRGAARNPGNRFERLSLDLDASEADGPRPRTEFLVDRTRSIIATNRSPDVPFDASVNPYRGCEHGCAYCFARPTHEYLGFSAGLDFETRILVKNDAPRLLAEALSRRSWEPRPLALSGVTDPYQPAEARLRLTRRCLEVLAEFRNPVAVITKNHLVTRDGDLLRDMAAWDGALVHVSIPTLDAGLAHVMEPRASTPTRRLDALRALSDAGVPTRVLAAPVIPGLTDHELPSILQAASDAGARSAGYVPLRLPYAVADLFEEWLGEHFSDRKAKVLKRIRTMRGGRRNDPDYGTRMRGEGVYADELSELFRIGCRRWGLDETGFRLSVSEFRRVSPDQGRLF